MSLLWSTAISQAQASWEDASDEARARRRQRADTWLDRQAPPGGTSWIPPKWGPYARSTDIHGIIKDHGGHFDDEHWGHLPLQDVSLRQKIHQHQEFIYPHTVKDKIDEGWEDDPHGHNQGWDEENPKIVRHEGEHYLLDGHHRFARDRLMGRSTIKARVFDTSDPSHRQDKCPDCQYDWETS